VISCAINLWHEFQDYTHLFKFEDFELKTNFMTADFAGNLTMGFERKEISDSFINFEFAAFPIRTSWAPEVVLEIIVIEKSSGIRYAPTFEFKLGPVSRDALGFVQNRGLHQNVAIELPVSADSIPEQAGETAAAGAIDATFIAADLVEKTKDLRNEMRTIIRNAENPGFSVTTREVLRDGTVPGMSTMEVVLPWHMDPELVELMKSGQALPEGFETPYIPIVQAYSRFARDHFFRLWEVEDNQKAIVNFVLTEIAPVMENVEPPATDSNSEEFVEWSLQYVLATIMAPIITALPNWAEAVEKYSSQK
jgi:hypothetical protein